VGEVSSCKSGRARLCRAQGRSVMLWGVWKKGVEQGSGCGSKVVHRINRRRSARGHAWTPSLATIAQPPCPPPQAGRRAQQAPQHKCLRSATSALTISRGTNAKNATARTSASITSEDATARAAAARPPAGITAKEAYARAVSVWPSAKKFTQNGHLRA
jgi:hypothetical protein